MGSHASSVSSYGSDLLPGVKRGGLFTAWFGQRAAIQRIISTLNGFGPNLLELGVVGIENAVQFLRRMVCVLQFSFAQSISDGRFQGPFMSYGSDVIYSSQFQLSTANHGGIDSSRHGPHSIHPTLTASAG